MWDALKLVCEEIFEDLELARSILDSCGVILPCGLLTEIYDSKGLRYNLPPYCICNPIISDNQDLPMSTSGSNQKIDKLKIRLSDGKDIILDLDTKQKISDIKNIIRFQENLDLNKRMVVLWCGRVLDEETKVEMLNLPKGAVLQVMLP